MSPFTLARRRARSSPTSARARAARPRTTRSAADWVADHWGDTLQPALLQHIKLAADRGRDRLRDRVRRRARRLPLPTRSTSRSASFSDFLYTIPSLALFQLLVPLTGLTVTTVEVALVSYTLADPLPEHPRGLRAVPAEVMEAARGMGLTRLQTLVRVELPLATPSIIAGVRIATVSTISIATVAAFVISRGPRPADLHRDQPGHLQDGDHRRRRARDPARARRRRGCSPCSDAPDALEAA